MAKNGFRVFDSDLHVIEPPDLYEKWLDPKYRDRAPEAIPSTTGAWRPSAWRIGEYVFPRAIGAGRTEADARARVVLASYDSRHYSPESYLEAMDVEGIDVAVLFRTLPVISIDDLEPDYALALCRAWNDWVTDLRSISPDRMHAAALLTLHDPQLAAEELRRCVENLGMVAAQMAPNPVNGLHIQDPRCDVLWAEAQRLDVPIAFHPAPNNYGDATFVNRFLTQPSTSIAVGLNNPVELMSAIGGMTVGGVFQRFPSLRVGFLEGNCSWLPWLLWRLDEFYGMCKGGEVAQLDENPSAYFLRQGYVSVEPDEHLARYVVEEVGDGVLVFSTDYPHSDSRFPEATESLLKLDLADESKARILWDNCARLYGPRVRAAAVA